MIEPQPISSHIASTSISVERLKQDIDGLILSVKYMADRASADRAGLGIHEDNKYILTAEELAWTQVLTSLEQARLQLNRTGKIASIGQSARAQLAAPDEPRLIKNQQDGTEKTMRTRDLIPAPDNFTPPTQGKRNV